MSAQAVLPPHPDAGRGGWWPEAGLTQPLPGFGHVVLPLRRAEAGAGWWTRGTSVRWGGRGPQRRAHSIKQTLLFVSMVLAVLISSNFPLEKSLLTHPREGVCPYLVKATLQGQMSCPSGVTSNGELGPAWGMGH